MTTISREMITPQNLLNRLLEESLLVERTSMSAISSPGPDPIENPHYLTNWYTALERRGALPNQVPNLPKNIVQILNGKCPIWGDRQKPDGTYYKYRDTWTLSLKTAETVHELANKVKAYGAGALNKNGTKLYLKSYENPFRLTFLGVDARQKYGEKRSNHAPYFILHTNKVLPGSEDLPYPIQEQMVAKLNTEADGEFQVPLLSETLTHCFNQKIASETSPYQLMITWNDRSSFTRTQEATDSYRMIAGGSRSSQVYALDNGIDDTDKSIGISVVRHLTP